jgi:threonine dehydrogenase-like Zn-dependent dehydrogenase
MDRVRVTGACICGSDLWPYNSMTPNATGNRLGHEFVGVVDSIGTDVRAVNKGDLVVAPFAWSDGTCEFCQKGLQTSCLHGGWWGETTLDGAQVLSVVRMNVRRAGAPARKAAFAGSNPCSFTTIFTLAR